MEKYTMIMDWKNQYYENYFTAQSNLQFNAIPAKLTRHFSQNQNKILQFVWKHKRPQVASATLRKNNRTGRVMHADLRLTTKLQ